jgi:hypothetical protein
MQTSRESFRKEKREVNAFYDPLIVLDFVSILTRVSLRTKVQHVYSEMETIHLIVKYTWFSSKTFPYPYPCTTIYGNETF